MGTPVRTGTALKLAACAAALLFLSGCWDYQDLENRAPILGMGFDLSDDPLQPIRASVEVPIAAAVTPVAGGQGPASERPPKEVFESDGLTISESVEMLSEVISRDLINRHVEAVVVSRDLAVLGLEPLVDYFLRNPQVNLRAQLWVTSGSARDVLRANPPFQPFTSFALETALQKSRLFPVIAPGLSIESFARQVAEGGAIVPRVEVRDGRLVTSGAGVFSPRARLVGFLNDRETVGTAWFTGTLRMTESTFPCPSNPGRHIGGRLRPSGRRMRFHLNEGRLSVSMEVSGTLELTNLDGCDVRPWRSPQDRRRLAEAAAGVVAADIEAAVRRSQDLGVDFLGIGLQLSRREPKLWRSLDWSALYPELGVAVTVRLVLDDPGGLHDGATDR